MAQQKRPDVIIHVLQRIESVEQSMEAFEDGMTGAIVSVGKDLTRLREELNRVQAGVATLGEEVTTGFGAVRREMGGLAKALWQMAVHEQRRLDDHETRLKKIEDQLDR